MTQTGAATVEPLIVHEEEAWRQRLAALGRRYGIELDQGPDPFDRYHRLLFELATEHVPGFAIADEPGGRLPGKGAPNVLDRLQTIRFAGCVYDALAAGMTSNGAIAVRALSRLDFTVPGKKGFRRVQLARSSATHLVKEMRSAWRAVLGGCASAYQFHVVCLALVSNEGYDTVADWAVIFGLRPAK